MYYEGLGVPLDYGEALKWYRSAAAQGHANAEYNLGVAYQQGCGVPQNQEEAANLYRLAAAHGSREADSALSHAAHRAARLPKFQFPDLKISGERAAISAARIVTSIMLFAALGSQPPAYYEVLRIIVCGVAAYSAYRAFPGRQRYAWFFIICAALFNPFLPVYLRDKSVWAVVDVAVGVAFLISVFVVRPAKQQ
jgi:TPR repeat protein